MGGPQTGVDQAWQQLPSAYKFCFQRCPLIHFWRVRGTGGLGTLSQVLPVPTPYLAEQVQAQVVCSSPRPCASVTAHDITLIIFLLGLLEVENHPCLFFYCLPSLSFPIRMRVGPGLTSPPYPQNTKQGPAIASTKYKFLIWVPQTWLLPSMAPVLATLGHLQCHPHPSPPPPPPPICLETTCVQDSG